MQLRPLTRRLTAKARLPAGLFPARRAQPGELKRELAQYLDDAAIEAVERAYAFGARAHEGQRRSSGEPYISHPLEVARLLAGMRMDSRSIIAAILHDVIEDTPTAKEQVAAEFGQDVADLVDGVSKIDKIEFESREEAEAENFRKMLLAMSQDIRVILIKLADRLHNLRTLDALALPKRRRIARQTLDIYAPIAMRLGMYEMARELEDLSFSHLYPNRYQAISRALRRRQGNRRTVVKQLMANLQSRLDQAGLKAQVAGRVKNVFNIYRKMREKRRSFDDIDDIYGFRIIVDSVDNCYRTLGIVHTVYKPIPGRFRDFIAIPKANGYQSLHTVLFGPFGESFEVQIRTEEMHRIAESGIAAHWLYKTGASDNVQPHEIARQWLLELLETQQQAGTAGEFLEHLRIDLFPDEVYVFTPRGEIKKLPRGATVLDFAYAVHSDVGHRTVGARVNNQRVPLNTALQNGQHVEIITARNARPSPLWLNYTVTGKARASIRTLLKNQRRKESIRLGKRLLDAAIKARGHRKRASDDDRTRLLESLKISTWDDLLADIGIGRRLPMIVARQLLPPVEGEEEGTPASIAPVPIHGVEGMLITYARCCRPIPGDPLIGFLTTGRGIVVHTADCPNVQEYRKHPDKWIPVHWADDVKGNFPVTLRLETENRPGVLAGLATIIAERGSNIDTVSVIDRDGRYSTMHFTIEVENRQHLAQLLRKLRRERSIQRVHRVKG